MTIIEPTKALNICFTGQRPKKLFPASPYGTAATEHYRAISQTLLQELKRCYTEKGSRNFISGGAQGFDQIAFWAVEALKRETGDTSIQNIVYVPFKGQESRWAKYGVFSQAEYQKMLKTADQVRYLREPGTDFKDVCYKLDMRNHDMVNDSDMVIAYYPTDTWRTDTERSGTKNCMRYAEKQGRYVRRIYVPIS